MKKKAVDYDKYVAKNKLKYLAKLSKLWLGYSGRIGRMKPRSPLESEMLIRLDEARRDRMLKSGELKILGPRCWAIKVFK